jgi:hypothetical protein
VPAAACTIRAVTDYDATIFTPVDLVQVSLDVYTDAYRVTGKAMTRFARVADIANQAANTHLHVDEATITEYADPKATVGAMQALVNMDVALLVITAESEAPQRPEMRIPKRSVRAQVGVPPFRLTGMVHVPPGSRPADGVLNATDRFLTMTEATIACAEHPELDRTATAIAFQRARAHLILVADDENPDQLLADVLDDATAERWLHAAEPEQL